jgi:hypothetical protein
MLGYSVSLKINPSKRFSKNNGIGVNANTRSWNQNELKPAIDLLLDSMNATIWRVIVETVEKWEDENDNKILSILIGIITISFMKLPNSKKHGRLSPT